MLVRPARDEVGWREANCLNLVWYLFLSKNIHFLAYIYCVYQKVFWFLLFSYILVLLIFTDEARDKQTLDFVWYVYQQIFIFLYYLLFFGKFLLFEFGMWSSGNFIICFLFLPLKFWIFSIKKKEEKKRIHLLAFLVVWIELIRDRDIRVQPSTQYNFY